MKRILYLITELDIGGAEKSLFQLATRIDRKRFEPFIACLMGHGELGAAFEKAGLPVTYIEMKGFTDIGAIFRLRALIKQVRPHILHSFLFHANVAGRLASKWLPISKRIASVRVEEPRRSHLFFERWTQRSSDVITCVSASTCEYMHLKAKIPLEKLVAIPNGIDPAGCDMPLMAPPAEWNIPEGAPTIASVGRLDHQKNPLMLLRVAEKVIREIPSAIFVFAGKGELQNACNWEAKRLGIEENVRWIGWVPDVRPLLARMDMLALTSLWEGMPNVVLEAMACRKPVVATKVGGSTELIEDEVTGFLIAPEDEVAFAEKILLLIRNLDRRNRMGIAARARVGAKFSINLMVKQNEKLYES